MAAEPDAFYARAFVLVACIVTRPSGAGLDNSFLTIYGLALSNRNGPLL